MPSGPSRKCSCRKHDIFAYNPSYEWTSHKTTLGTVMSYLSIAFIGFYIFLTTRDYVVRPPELVSQGDIDVLQVEKEYPFDPPLLGICLGYTNTSNAFGPQPALQNNNPYVRFQFKHVVMEDQQRVNETILPVKPCTVSSRPSMCPVIQNNQYLQGIFYKHHYQFIEIIVSKCTNSTTCASLEEINQKMHSGEFRVKAQISLEAQQFDVELFHLTGSGIAVSNRSFDYFALPDIEVQGDIVLQARQIMKEQRYIGSPPMPETQVNVLSVLGRDTDYLPRTAAETTLFTFVIRLADSVKLEEVAYWCPSILDLFGLWGAMTSFVAALSLGFIAMQYNKWHFHRHFRRATHQKRVEARRQTLAATEWVRNKNDRRPANDTITSRHRDIMYKNLQAQYDSLIVEPDLRLFEPHHFNSQGLFAMNPVELKHPSTAFGELRRMAILEHGKKKRAAQFISLWYARHLVLKGFISDPQRQRAIFAPADSHLMTPPRVQRRHSNLLPRALRRRRNTNLPQIDSASTTDNKLSQTDARLDDMERGVVGHASSESVSSMSSIHPFCLPQGSVDESIKEQDSGINSISAEEQKARDVIAEMGFSL